MRYLIDTSILVRLSSTNDPQYDAAQRATRSLLQGGSVLRITAQNLVEFRNAATRPLAVNGLGWPAREAENQAAQFEALFPLLEETPAIFPAWKALVAAAGVVGKRVHDARLVAVRHAHGVTHPLAFNSAHFVRLAGFGPGIVVVHPADV